MPTLTELQLLELQLERALVLFRFGLPETMVLELKFECPLLLLLELRHIVLVFIQQVFDLSQGNRGDR